MRLTWTGSDVIYATKFPKHSRKIKWFYMFGVRPIIRWIRDVIKGQVIFVIAELK